MKTLVDRYTPSAASRTTTPAPSRKTSGYPGSKGGNGVWHRIIAQIPPHDLYVECYAGSAKVLWHKRPAAASIAIDSDPAVCKQLWTVLATRSEFAGVHVVCDAAVHWLESNRNRLNRRTVVYCDPPYLAEVRSYQGAYYNHQSDLPAQHESLIGVLSRLTAQGVPCLISGYRGELYDRLLSNWRRVDFQAATHRGPVTESLWCNFPEPTELHQYDTVGNGWRERQRIKRKARRWVRMLDDMDPVERAAVLAEIDAAYRSTERHGADEVES